MSVNAHYLRNRVTGNKFSINKYLFLRKWPQVHSFLQAMTRALHGLKQEKPAVNEAVFYSCHWGVQPSTDTWSYCQEHNTITSGCVTRVLKKILGKIVELTKKVVALTFSVIWGKTKTWTTESKHDSKESGFECEFLQALESTHFDFMFSHVCAVICDKNVSM